MKPTEIRPPRTGLKLQNLKTTTTITVADLPSHFDSTFPGAYCMLGIQYDQNRSNVLSDIWGPAGRGYNKVGKTPSTQDSEKTAMERAMGQEQRPLMKKWETGQSTSEPFTAHTPRCRDPGQGPTVLQARVGETGHRKATHRAPRRLQTGEPLVQGLTSPLPLGRPETQRPG